MIGVILWFNADDGKAVIWCEDQGDLAYLGRLDGLLDPVTTLDVGDVVRFDMQIERNMRLARNVTLLLDNWGSTLGDVLRLAPQDSDRVIVSKGAEIVPFNDRRKTQSSSFEQARSHKLG